MRGSMAPRGAAAKLARVCFLAFGLLLLRPGTADAQSAQEYAIKASFICKFLSFVQWPESDAGGKPVPGAFVVAVLGSDPFRDNLKRAFLDDSVAGRPVEIKTVSELKDLDQSRVVFISGDEKNRLDKLIRWAAENRALTIGDGEGFAEKGVIINFYQSEDRVRFEINPQAAEKSGLRISSLLLKVARIVGD